MDSIRSFLLLLPIVSSQRPAGYSNTDFTSRICVPEINNLVYGMKCMKCHCMAFFLRNLFTAWYFFRWYQSLLMIGFLFGTDKNEIHLRHGRSHCWSLLDLKGLGAEKKQSCYLLLHLSSVLYAKAFRANNFFCASTVTIWFCLFAVGLLLKLQEIKCYCC